MNDFWSNADKYYKLTDSSKALIGPLLQRKMLARQEIFLHEGAVPRNVAFIESGLLAYYYTDSTGNRIIKRFFKEQEFVSSLAASITGKPGAFTIEALEDTVLYQFPFTSFKALVNTHFDVALLYIHYLEKNWVTDKEPMEIILKHQTARQRYLDFMKEHASLAARLKQHHIASYLGITPTQLSRIRAEEH
ncbi:Crp/Fnr family transcriptional regulator [Chitinophaga sp. Mgbs1]|uniref:Crp/Fnr family transcriptional regulator n=1 Tax=Chitinophaga solisilvae TaxID=1233460 RepID=A0A433WET6_9BACT|nr:Crp/Fnr family transcriptional regulator [Chitinophaga solisilvae]